MVTRRAAGITKLVDCLQLSVATSPTLSPVLTSARSELTDPHWRCAVEEVYEALLSNRTWELVPRPPGVNVVTDQWIKHKLMADGSLDKYKARWVLRGFTHSPDVDFDETFSPVVKPTTVHTLVLSRCWPGHQLHVKNAFLHDTLSEMVYCSQPTGFVDPTHYFVSYLVSLHFVEAKSDTSLFVDRRSADVAYLLLYIDDIILTISSPQLLQRTTTALRQQFARKDLDPLHHFLSISMEQRVDDLFLHQRQYSRDILERIGMSDCKPCSMSVDTQAKVSSNTGTPIRDPTAYHSLVGALQYLTFTKPDISYATKDFKSSD
jgi:hypothetical protein